MLPPEPVFMSGPARPWAVATGSPGPAGKRLLMADTIARVRAKLVLLRTSSMPSGLVTIDYVKGNGEAPIVAGDSYTVEYEGWLASGYKFDSSREKGQPLTVRPAMAVIQGWTEGVMGASKGTVRRIMVPGNLAYVGMRRGMIPSDAPLYFEIEVVNVEKASAVKPGAIDVDAEIARKKEILKQQEANPTGK